MTGDVDGRGVPEPTTPGEFVTPAEQGSRVAALQRLATIARELGTSRQVDDATAASRRLEEQRFFVACVGQFKRGKSTVLNALVRHDVLPVAVTPVTSVITVLRYGPSPASRVQFLDGRSSDIDVGGIGDYIDERRNPGNERGAAGVEVFLPSPLLADGLCLVDTPGVGSVFTTNTDATQAFLPQIDAALVVLGADPPVSKIELDLIVAIAGQVPDIIVVLNKADRHTPGEMAEARVFTEDIIGRHVARSIMAPLEISAWERLQQGRATRDWTRLEERLAALRAESRSRILWQAGTRTVHRIARQLQVEIAERERALREPVATTAARVDRLRRDLLDANRSLVDLAYLFAAAEADLGRAYERLRDQFLDDARITARAELERWLAVDRHGSAQRRRLAYEEARAIATRLIHDWLERVEPEAEALYRNGTQRFVALANEFVSRLSSDGPGAPSPDAQCIVVEAGFHERRHFFFASLMSRTAEGPLSWIGDRVLPPRFRARHVARAAQEYLETLLWTNAMRVENDFRDRVLESRRWLEQQVRFCLGEMVATGERALDDAQRLWARGREAIEERLSGLADLRREVESLATVGDA